MKILFTGGGTGGHIFPIIAIVRELKKTLPEKELNLYYIGPKDDFAFMLFSQEGVKTKRILAGKIRRYLGIKSFFLNILDIFKTLIGIFQAFFYIFFLNPDLIFSKGGYGSLPSVIAGTLLRVPIFLHESDIVPGLANKIVGKFAIEIFASFERTEFFPLSKMIVVGNPIRKELLNGSKERAKEIFGIQGEKKVILILGGSQGAERINNVILNILPELLKNFELLHQTGEKNFKNVKKEAEIILPDELKKFYHPVPFLKENELREAYAISDLIISRAGSGAIFEIAAVGKPSILIPLPESAQNHQLKNAYAFAKNGACIVLEEANFTPHFFLEKIKNLFENPSVLEKMKESAKKFSKPEAGKIIASYLIEYLKK